MLFAVLQWAKCFFNLLPFGNHKNDSGRFRNGQEIKIPIIVRLFVYMCLCIPILKNQQWSKNQLDQKILSCGDVESNPGPEFVDNGSIKCMQLNLNGWKSAQIDKKLDEVRPQVAIFSETHLNESKNCSVKGYVIFRQDRITARGGEGAPVSGGGLVTLIRDDAETRSMLSIIEMPKLDSGHDNVTEVLQAKVLYRNTSIVFSNIYRPPIWNHAGEMRVDHFEAENVLGRCISSCTESQHVICADANAHHPIWDNIAKEDHHGQEIYEWCVNAHMDLANDGSITYMSSSQARKSSPDITMSSPGLIVQNWAVIAALSPISSDHLPTSFNIFIRNNGEEKRIELKAEIQLLLGKNVIGLLLMKG